MIPAGMSASLPASMALLVSERVKSELSAGSPVRLPFTPLTTPQELLLQVLDSGPGVPVELRERLFERFFRIGDGQGAGLGLSIVRRVVELHQGSIALDESPLGGLRVSVRLPRHPSSKV